MSSAASTVVKQLKRKAQEYTYPVGFNWYVAFTASPEAIGDVISRASNIQLRRILEAYNNRHKNLDEANLERLAELAIEDICRMRKRLAQWAQETNQQIQFPRHNSDEQNEIWRWLDHRYFNDKIKEGFEPKWWKAFRDWDKTAGRATGECSEFLAAQQPAFVEISDSSSSEKKATKKVKKAVTTPVKMAPQVTFETLQIPDECNLSDVSNAEQAVVIYFVLEHVKQSKQGNLDLIVKHFRKAYPELKDIKPKTFGGVKERIEKCIAKIMSLAGSQELGKAFVDRWFDEHSIKLGQLVVAYEEQRKIQAIAKAAAPVETPAMVDEVQEIQPYEEAMWQETKEAVKQIVAQQTSPQREQISAQTKQLLENKNIPSDVSTEQIIQSLLQRESLIVSEMQQKAAESQAMLQAQMELLLKAQEDLSNKLASQQEIQSKMFAELQKSKQDLAIQAALLDEKEKNIQQLESRIQTLQRPASPKPPAKGKQVGDVCFTKRLDEYDQMSDAEIAQDLDCGESLACEINSLDMNGRCAPASESASVIYVGGKKRVISGSEKQLVEEWYKERINRTTQIMAQQEAQRRPSAQLPTVAQALSAMHIRPSNKGVLSSQQMIQKHYLQAEQQRCAAVLRK